MPDHKPPLAYHALTGFYDRILAATLREAELKGRLVEAVAPLAAHRILDLGCGTGTLTAMLKHACPEAAVTGLDADARALDIARRKYPDLASHFVVGWADAPPFPEGTFDRVVSSLMFHHLQSASKVATFARAKAVLAPGGELHVLDWGEARDTWSRLAFLGIQLLDGFATTQDNVKGLLPAMMRDVGFADVEESHRARTLFGTLSLYRATRPR